MKRFIVLLSAMILCLTLAGCSGSQYKKATELYEQGNYAEAGEIFSKLGNYEDSADKANECKYQEASALLQNSDYDAAKALFSALGDYGDSADKVKFCDYKKAEKLLADDDYDAAKAIFSALGSYENSADQVKECDYEKAEELFNQEKYEEALKIYETISEYKTSKERIITINSKFLYETYGDIIDLLDNGAWFFDGGYNGDYAVVNRLTFNKEKATVTPITYDGNGKNDGTNQLYTYILDDKEITLMKESAKYRTIPYIVKNGKIELGKGDYFTPEEVDAGLQGYWDNHEVSFLPIVGLYEGENIYYFNAGKLTYESATRTNRRSSNYTYFGPYTGTYTVDKRGLTTDLENGADFLCGFNISDNQIVMTDGGTPCNPCSGFKGKDGYSFH